MTLTSLLTLLPLALPVVVTFIAGVLRQDGLPKQANEGITVGLVLAAAVLNALYNHALTSNLELDFVIVAAYTASIIQMPQLQALQGYLQGNVLNIIKAVEDLPVLPPAPLSITIKASQRPRIDNGG